MKIRSDFVSNSSSCSFFISLSTNEELNGFKQIVKSLVDNGAQLTVFNNLEDANKRWNVETEYLEDSNKNILLHKGCVVLCDACDDHDIDYESKFYCIEDIVDSCNPKLKKYRDNEAHMTVGDDLPKVDVYYINNEYWTSNWD